MSKKKEKSALELRVILIALITAAILSTMIIIGISSFKMFEKVIVEKMANSRVDVLMQVSEKVSALKSNALMLSNLCYHNENITGFDPDKPYTLAEQEKIRENFENIEMMSEMTRQATGLDFYYTFAMKNGYTYCSLPEQSGMSLEDYNNMLWYLELDGKEEQWVSTYADSRQRNVISIARNIMDDSGEIIGLFLFNIYEDNFRQAFSALADQNNMYIIDSAGTIITHSDEDLIGIHFYDMDIMQDMFTDSNYNIIEKSQEEYLFSVYENQDIKWFFVEEIPLNLLLRDVAWIQRSMLLIGLGVFLVSIIACTAISNKTTRPLRQLITQLEQVGKSEETYQVFDVQGWKEINAICNECNYMTERIQELVTEIKAAEKKKRAAELGFLQTQMSPHFLYNTLFSIRCLVDLEDKESAIGIIDSFTSILKYILSYENEFIDVSQEIKFLEDYARLQKYRYGDNLSLNIICPEELLTMKILRMVLEPLVENSLFHGQKDKKERIHIEIEFQAVESDMLITITDDGKGFTAEGYEQLRKKIRTNAQSNMIGMNNIRDRIKMFFGKKYGIRIDTAYQNGARVIIRMPMID